MDASYSFGTWLRQRRKALDLTQGELARRVGCATVTLQKIELDERRASREIAERLAAELGLAPAERPAFIRSARGELAVDQLQAAAPATPTGPLPTGTVTFLFTDIVGSTQRWEAQPEAMRVALARHDALLRAAITSNDGVVFKTVGDAFYAVFTTAADAVQAALAGQRALTVEPWVGVEAITVRMALQSGSAELREGDYFGAVLNRTARLLATGHGGQVLLAAATQELVRDQLPPGTMLRDLGAHQLADVSRSEHLFQLVAPGLPADFPPLRVPHLRHHNLQAQPTAFIGREREVQMVLALVQQEDARLLTLTGPGGTGKTRLSLKVAEALLDSFADGVWVVDLAPISDPALVTSAIATVLGIQEVGGRPLHESLATSLAEKQLLLVLDNFEQVAPAAPLVTMLLQAAPRLSVLVTSRAALRLRGEREFPVPPLALPDPRQLPALERLRQYEAVALFIVRAQDVKPDFQVTTANAPAVAEICSRLDGLPLAIELAAVRVKVLPPAALLARLEHRLRVLTGGARDLGARQQTLRGTIDWSYQLLTAEEQTVFARLGVFVGGCTLEAAETVCSITQEVPDDQAPDVLDAVASLVDKSLLRQAEGTEGEPRFTMLETIREYARERLTASPEAEALRRRHATYYLALAEAAELALRGSEQLTWLDRLETEYDNLRAALAWSQRIPGPEGTTSDDVEIGLRLVGALWRFWLLRGYFEEWDRWSIMAVAYQGQRTDVPPAVRARLLFARANIEIPYGTLASALAFGEESLALYREVGDGWAVSSALVFVGRIHLFLDDESRGHPTMEESLRLAREVGEPWLIAWVLHEVGWTLLYPGRRQTDMARAKSLLEEGLVLAREAGDAWLLAQMLLALGEWALAQGDYRRVVALNEECLALQREGGDKVGITNSLLQLARVNGPQGDYAAVSALTEERLRIERELGNKGGIAHSIVSLARAAWAQTDYPRATALYEEALVLMQALGDEQDHTWALRGLGNVARSQGETMQAAARLEHVLALSRSRPEARGLLNTLTDLGQVVHRQGDSPRAAALFRECLEGRRERGDRPGIVDCLAGFAGIAAAQGESTRAARLFGAVEAVCNAIGIVIPGPDRRSYDRDMVTARAALDSTTWEMAWAEGLAMTLEQAIAYALGDGSQENEAGAASPYALS